MSSATDSPIWERVASPALAGLTPTAARAILRMKFTPADERRIHALSALAKQGTLGGAERGELEVYLQVGHLLTLMHSKARVALKPGDPRKRRKTA